MLPLEHRFGCREFLLGHVLVQMSGSPWLNCPGSDHREREQREGNP